MGFRELPEFLGESGSRDDHHTSVPVYGIPAMVLKNCWLTRNVEEGIT